MSYLPEETTHLGMVYRLAQIIDYQSRGNARTYLKGSEAIRVMTDGSSGDFSHRGDPTTVDPELISDIDITVLDAPTDKRDILPGAEFLASCMYEQHIRQMNQERVYPQKFERRSDLPLMSALVYAPGSGCERVWEFELLKGGSKALKRAMHGKGFLRSTTMLNLVNGEIVGLPGYKEDLKKGILRAIHLELLDEIPHYNVWELRNEIKSGNGDLIFEGFPRPDHPYLDPMSVKAFYEHLLGVAKLPHVAQYILSRDVLTLDPKTNKLFEEIQKRLGTPYSPEYLLDDVSLRASCGARIKKSHMTARHTVRAYCQLTNSVFSKDFGPVFDLAGVYENLGDENAGLDLKTKSIIAFEHYMNQDPQERHLALTYAIPLFYAYRYAKKTSEEQISRRLRELEEEYGDEELKNLVDSSELDHVGKQLENLKEELERDVHRKRVELIKGCARKYINRKDHEKEVSLLLSLAEKYYDKFMDETPINSLDIANVAADMATSLEKTRLAPVHLLDLYDAIWTSEGSYANEVLLNGRSIEQILHDTEPLIGLPSILNPFFVPPKGVSPKQRAIETATKNNWLNALETTQKPVVTAGTVLGELNEYAKRVLIPQIRENGDHLKRNTFTRPVRDVFFRELLRRQTSGEITTGPDALQLLVNMTKKLNVAQMLLPVFRGDKIDLKPLENTLSKVEPIDATFRNGADKHTIE